MASLMNKLSDVFAAVAFAEVGEHETAKRMLEEDEAGNPPKSPSFYEPADLVLEED